MKKKFLIENTVKYLGEHILVEVWSQNHLDNLSIIRRALREMVKAVGATLIDLKLYKFSPQGISGIAIIAESHISIHTWPEHDYAAIDIFTCGISVNPYAAISVIKRYFTPKNIKIINIKRGILI